MNFSLMAKFHSSDLIFIQVGVMATLSIPNCPETDEVFPVDPGETFQTFPEAATQKWLRIGYTVPFLFSCGQRSLHGGVLCMFKWRAFSPGTKTFCIISNRTKKKYINT